MIDHVGIVVSDLDASKAFYEKALAPLGYGIQEEPDQATVGIGTEGMPFLWLSERVPAFWGAEQSVGGAPVHVAFSADSRSTVDAFFEEAIRAGGKDNGPPGLRPHYHPNYYGAFVLDLDGNNIEAVCHEKEFAEVVGA